MGIVLATRVHLAITVNIVIPEELAAYVSLQKKHMQNHHLQKLKLQAPIRVNVRRLQRKVRGVADLPEVEDIAGNMVGNYN